MYFTELNLVIECDENGHADRKPYNERERMDFVNKKLNIDDSHWIRYNSDEHDFDISKVINKVYRKISEIRKETDVKNNINQIRLSDISKIFEKENPVLEYKTGDKYTIDLFFPKQKIIFEFNKNNRSRNNYINTFLKINDTHWLDSVCISCRKEEEQKIINTPKITPEKKICSKCKETKNTVKEFHKRKKSLDGYQGVCKLCENNRRKNKKEEVKEFKRCITCNKIKNTEISFFKSQKCKDGYRNVCKECVNNQEGVKNSILKKKKEKRTGRK